EDGIRDRNVTGVQTCALPISGDNALGGCGGAVENRRVRLGGAHAQGVPIVLDLEAAAVAGDDRVDAARVAGVGVVEPEGAQAGPARTVGGEDLHAVEGVAALAVRAGLGVGAEEHEVVTRFGDAAA